MTTSIQIIDKPIAKQLENMQKALELEISTSEKFPGISNIYAEPVFYSEITYLMAISEAQEELGIITLNQVDEDSAEIAKLYVKPTARRNGLGLHLFHDGLSNLKKSGVDMVFIQIKPEASEFWEKALKQCVQSGLSIDWLSESNALLFLKPKES